MITVHGYRFYSLRLKKDKKWQKIIGASFEDLEVWKSYEL